MSESMAVNYRSPGITWLLRLRYGAIRLLAGNCVVVLNTRISVVPRMESHIEVKNVDGALLCRNHFSVPEGYAFLLQQVRGPALEIDRLIGWTVDE